MIAAVFPILTFFALLGSALMAGLFFAFSVSVMGALARLPAGQGAAAMNAINIAILNPVFLTVFMGTTLLCAILAVKAVIGWNEPGSAWLLAGSLSYLVGIFAVTVVFNVPLNDALAADGAVWSRYLTVWVPWNHVRAIAGLLALASFWLAGR